MKFGMKDISRLNLVHETSGFQPLIRSPVGLKANSWYHDIFRAVGCRDLKFGTNLTCMLKWTYRRFGRDQFVCLAACSSQNHFLRSRYLQKLRIYTCILEIWYVGCTCAKLNARNFWCKLDQFLVCFRGSFRVVFLANYFSTLQSWLTFDKDEFFWNFTGTLTNFVFRITNSRYRLYFQHR